MRSRPTNLPRAVATAAAAVMAVGVAAQAGAATVSVTGNDGAPIPLVAGQPLEIANIAPQLAVAIEPRTENISLSVVAPDGAPATTTASCYSIPINRHLDYRGNGNYTITMTRFAANDYTCRTPLGTETLGFTINSGVGMGALPANVLTRRYNGATNTHNLQVAAAPGAITTEVRYARGATLGPDGGIVGASDTAYLDRTTGLAGLRFSTPGRYTIVARSKGSGAGEGAHTPWSAPVVVRARAPFELLSLRYPDSRGPHYRLRGVVRDATTRGRVVVAMARGAKGGRFRVIGRPKITKKGVINLGFTQRTPGVYRLRLIHRGSATVAPGSVTYRMRITRTVTYR